MAEMCKYSIVSFLAPDIFPSFPLSRAALAHNQANQGLTQSGRQRGITNRGHCHCKKKIKTQNDKNKMTKLMQREHQKGQNSQQTGGEHEIFNGAQKEALKQIHAYQRSCITKYARTLVNYYVCSIIWTVLLATLAASSSRARPNVHNLLFELHSKIQNSRQVQYTIQNTFRGVGENKISFW